MSLIHFRVGRSGRCIPNISVFTSRLSGILQMCPSNYSFLLRFFNGWCVCLLQSRRGCAWVRAYSRGPYSICCLETTLCIISGLKLVAALNVWTYYKKVLADTKYSLSPGIPIQAISSQICLACPAQTRMLADLTGS